MPSVPVERRECMEQGSMHTIERGGGDACTYRDGLTKHGDKLLLAHAGKMGHARMHTNMRVKACKEEAYTCSERRPSFHEDRSCMQRGACHELFSTKQRIQSVPFASHKTLINTSYAQNQKPSVQPQA